MPWREVAIEAFGAMLTTTLTDMLLGSAGLVDITGYVPKQTTKKSNLVLLIKITFMYTYVVQDPKLNDCLSISNDSVCRAVSCVSYSRALFRAPFPPWFRVDTWKILSNRFQRHLQKFQNSQIYSNDGYEFFYRANADVSARRNN